jgi:uncharacterized protein YeaO (DUF488 family)
VSCIDIRRVYAPPTAKEGRRVLVDRVWPRGVKKAELGDVVWLKDVAPTTGLRKWFGHDPARWSEFRRLYFAELDANPAVDQLRELAGKGHLTLLYGARDETHNQAAALAEYLNRDRSAR